MWQHKKTNICIRAVSERGQRGKERLFEEIMGKIFLKFEESYWMYK